MTDQSQLPQFSIAELGARFGAQQAQDFAQIITLEKQVTAHIQTIQELTKNQAVLVDHIQQLEEELAGLKQLEQGKESPNKE